MKISIMHGRKKLRRYIRGYLPESLDNSLILDQTDTGVLTKEQDAIKLNTYGCCNISIVSASGK